MRRHRQCVCYNYLMRQYATWVSIIKHSRFGASQFRHVRAVCSGPFKFWLNCSANTFFSNTWDHKVYLSWAETEINSGFRLFLYPRNLPRTKIESSLILGRNWSQNEPWLSSFACDKFRFPTHRPFESHLGPRRSLKWQFWNSLDACIDNKNVIAIVTTQAYLWWLPVEQRPEKGYR